MAVCYARAATLPPARPPVARSGARVAPSPCARPFDVKETRRVSFTWSAHFQVDALCARSSPHRALACFRGPRLPSVPLGPARRCARRLHTPPPCAELVALREHGHHCLRAVLPALRPRGYAGGGHPRPPPSRFHLVPGQFGLSELQGPGHHGQALPQHGAAHDATRGSGLVDSGRAPA